MSIKSNVDQDRRNADSTVKITRGPALLIAKGVGTPNAPSVLHRSDAISLNTNADSSETVSGAIGIVARQSRGERLELKVKPVGYWGNLDVWYPMLAMQGGDRLLPEDNTDPLDVLCLTNLKVYRFWRAGVIKMSGLKGGPGVELMEEMTLGIGRKDGVGFADAESLMKVYDLTKATVAVSYGNGQTTATIPFNGTAAQWQAALNAVAAVNGEPMVVTYKTASTVGLTTLSTTADIQTAVRALHADLAAATVTGSYSAGFTIADIAGEALADFTATVAGSAANVTVAEVGEVKTTQMITPKNYGVTVTGSHRDGGLVVTWNLPGARATAFTGALVGLPSNAVFVQTVLTTGTSTVREVRLFRINPYMAAFTAALASTPKRTYLLSYLSAATWRPTWGATTGAALACNISAADLQTALRTVCADANLSVAGSMRDGWTITRTAGVVANTLGATIAGAPPGTYLKVRILTAGAANVSQVELVKLSPWASFGQYKEWALDWKEEVKPIAPLGQGTRNWEFVTLKPQFKVPPDSLLLEDAISGSALQADDTAELGSDLTELAQRLDIIGRGIYIGLPKTCFSRELQTQWGADKEHVENLTFDAVRGVDSNGLLQPFALL